MRIFGWLVRFLISRQTYFLSAVYGIWVLIIFCLIVLGGIIVLALVYVLSFGLELVCGLYYGFVLVLAWIGLPLKVTFSQIKC